MIKVRHIKSLTNTEHLFESKDHLLGDGGEWVVTDDELFYGRYTDKSKAEEHAASLNDESEIEGKSADELFDEYFKLAEKADYILNGPKLVKK